MGYCSAVTFNESLFKSAYPNHSGVMDISKPGGLKLRESLFDLQHEEDILLRL